MTDPASNDDVLSDDARERIAAYESWAMKLEQRHSHDQSRQGLYVKAFAALTTAGFACFAFGLHMGVWGSFSATLISLVGFGMIKTRLWELRSEIDETRAQIERIRSGRSSRSQ